jgi:hypothetical protein
VERNIPQSKMVVPEDRNVLQQNLDKVILDKSGPQDTGQKMEQNTRFEHSRESNFSHFSRNEQRGSGAVPQNLDRGTGQGAEFRHSGGSGAPFSEMVRPNAQQPGIVEPRDYTVTPQQHYVPEAGTAAQNFNRGAEQGTRFERHNEPNIPHSEVTRTVGEFAGERNRAAVNDVTSAIGRAHSRRAREDEERAVNNKLYRKVPENAGVPFSGDAILDRLRVSSEFHRTENINTEKQAGVIKSISQEVAERILASTAALNARQEVRVMIKDNILRNTEVIIAKDGKMVSVDFFTSALESASLLSSKQSDLRSHLLNTLQDVNDVDVNIYQETDEANPDDSKDGRSRDEYVGDEDDSNEGKGARRNFRN